MTPPPGRSRSGRSKTWRRTASSTCEIWHSALRPYIEYALSDGARGSAANRYPGRVRRDAVRMGGSAYAWPATRFGTGGAEEHVWRQKILEKRDEICSLKGRDVDVAILGGGVLGNWDYDGKGFADWKDGRTTLVLAGFHDSFGNVMWNARNGFLDGYRAKVVVVSQCEPWPGASAAEKADGLRQLVEVVRLKQPQAKVVVTSIWPTKADGTDAEKSNVAANKTLKEALGKMGNVQWVEMSGAKDAEEWKKAVAPAAGL